MQYLPYAVVVLVTGGLLFLKTNAALVFLAVCGGYAVGTLAGTEIGVFAESVLPQTSLASAAVAALSMLPAVILAVAFKGTVHGGRIVLQILPATAAAAFGTVAVVYQLGADVKNTLVAYDIWVQLFRLDWALALIGLWASLIIVLLSLRKKAKGDHHKKGHHG